MSKAKSNNYTYNYGDQRQAFNKILHWKPARKLPECSTLNSLTDIIWLIKSPFIHGAFPSGFGLDATPTLG